MSKIGRLNTSKTLERAIIEIREWLSKLSINGLSINTNYDARLNVALIKFNYKDVNYEFRSTKQSNCRLNMWGIARVMEYKVRASLMGIEDFEKSMKSYAQLEDKSGSSYITPEAINQKNYVILGISPISSNEEIKKRYMTLVKTFHPDMALSEEAKTEFNKK